MKDFIIYFFPPAILIKTPCQERYCISTGPFWLNERLFNLHDARHHPSTTTANKKTNWLNKWYESESSQTVCLSQHHHRRERIAPSSTTPCCLSVKTCARVVSNILNKCPVQLFFQVTSESLTTQTTRRRRRRRRRLQQWGRICRHQGVCIWKKDKTPLLTQRPGHSTWADWFPISSVSLITACLEGCNGSNISPLYTRTSRALFKAWCSMCGSARVCGMVYGWL